MRHMLQRWPREGIVTRMNKDEKYCEKLQFKQGKVSRQFIDFVGSSLVASSNNECVQYI